MAGDVFQESGWDCFCSSHSISPQGPTGRPTSFSPLLRLGLSLQPKEQSLRWNKVLAPGLCQVGLRSWWQDQNNHGLPVLVLGYQRCLCSEHQRPGTDHGWLKDSSWGSVGHSSHTSTAEHRGEAEIVNDSYKDLQAFHLFSVPAPRAYS